MAEALEVEEHDGGEVIYRQGEHGDRFYIIKEGTVIVSKGRDQAYQVLERLSERAYFGERALIKTDTRYPPPAINYPCLILQIPKCHCNGRLLLVNADPAFVCTDLRT